jgi:mRNA interferase MazF
MKILRADIYLADLDPTRGHEQAGKRPVLIISEDLFNSGPADLVIAIPLTSVVRSISSHVLVSPPEGGLKKPSAIMCEAVRSLSKERLLKKWGSISEEKMLEVEGILRMLMRL